MFKLTKYLVSILLLAVINCYSQSDAFQSNKKYIQLATGINLAYIEKGHHNPETILLLHGYTDSSRSFKDVIEELYRLNPQSRIIVPDLRGHGSSGVPNSSDAFKLEDFTNDLLDLIQQLKVTKVDIVGHSFGSVIAQRIALTHPEKVKSLVLMGTFVNGSKNMVVQDVLIKELVFGQWKTQLQNWYGSEWTSKIMTLTPRDLGEEIVQFLKESWVSEARADAVFLSSLSHETLQTPLLTWFETLNTISGLDHSKSLSQLQTPTLILWGEDDDITPEHPDQQDLKIVLQQAADDLQTPIFYKTYRKNAPNELKIGHNFHWAFSKEVAEDILMFTQNMAINTTVEKEVYQIKK